MDPTSSPMGQGGVPHREWLVRLGLDPAVEHAGWRLATSSLRGAPHGELELSFARGADAVRVRLRPRDPARRAFSRSPSFDLEHLSVPKELGGAVEQLMRAITERVTRHDPGGLALPSAVEGAAPPAAAPVTTPAAAPVSASAAPAPEQDATGGAYGSGSAEEPRDDPALRVDGEHHFLDWYLIDVSEVGRFPDAIRDMYRGALGGLIVRNVFSPDHMAQVVKRLEDNTPGYHTNYFPARFKSRFFGRCLDGADLTGYLDEAEAFHESTGAAFAGGPDYRARLEEVLGRLSGGRPVTVPRYTDGRSYTCSTIRVLPTGGQIGTHCGNEASTRPAYHHLNTIIDRHDQISFFVTLQAPQAGGELVVYSLTWSDIGPGDMVNGRSNVEPLLPRARWTAYHPGPGDLLIFDGGRFFHRVSVVRGPTTRWTIGGFMMFSSGGDTLYYWS